MASATIATDNAFAGMTESERGYWRDVGSVDAYWQANMDLLEATPEDHPQIPQYPSDHE